MRLSLNILFLRFTLTGAAGADAVVEAGATGSYMYSVIGGAPLCACVGIVVSTRSHTQYIRSM